MTETADIPGSQALKILEGLVFLAGEDGLDLWQLQAGMPEYTREELEAGCTGCRKTAYPAGSIWWSMQAAGGLWPGQRCFPMHRISSGKSGRPLFPLLPSRHWR